MENKYKELHGILQSLLGSHRLLLEAVRVEHDALINLDAARIQECTDSKEALIQAISQAEKQRIVCVGVIAAALKKPAAELTLPFIILAAQDVDARISDALRTSYNAIKLLVSRIDAQNKENKLLVERSLEHIQNMKRNAMLEKSGKAATYNPQGQRMSASQQEARLISKEA